MEIDMRLIIDAAQLIVWIIFLLLLFGIMAMYIHETKVLQNEHIAVEAAIKSKSSKLQSESQGFPETVTDGFSNGTNQLMHELDNIREAIRAIDKNMAVEAIHREHLETLLNEILQKQNM
ncbi:hypothetical protein [Faecalispora jeddahensis]|uniref:hypothetical protein n=1 Tax=Faecalispora jeddahensis TaxID=1414721 RepID=UPI0028AACCBE|nr:hypothetical protein [Faecalispora jeddahensis]